MLEAQTLNRVGELDVDGEVVGVELQLVVGRQAGVLADIHRQRGDGSPGGIKGEFPVLVIVGTSVERDH